MAALTFPRSVLARVWREAKTGEEPFLSLLDGAAPSHGDWTLVADRLCARAAAVLQDRPGDVWPDPSPPAPIPNLSPAAVPRRARRSWPAVSTWPWREPPRRACLRGSTAPTTNRRRDCAC
ncbi:hypothetical protein [Brevundimonas aurantiaca]|uniref:hypothetical protein n=1 Tax=Brevundimonas aurantiaca TaxID=74316 RepID=UPI001CD2594A|nr:hypothetical protein [Brevundimonas aurantiaca]